MLNRFNTVKLKFLSIAIISILLTFVTQGTLAYYSTVGKAVNVVTMGEIKMEIHETTMSSQNQPVPFPEDGVYITPGDIVSKKVEIKNVCDQPFYLRVKMVYGIENTELTSDECFSLNINEEYWKLVDGWYYYTDILEPDEITPHVFSEVEIVGAKLDNSYFGKTLTLTVKAQAVQSKNNPVENMATHTASGWPVE